MYHELTFDFRIGNNLADVLVTALVCYAIVATVGGLVIAAVCAAKAAR